MLPGTREFLSIGRMGDGTRGAVVNTNLTGETSLSN